MIKNKIDYLLIGIVIALTGFEVCFRASMFVKAGILICIAYYFFLERKKFNPDFFLVAFLFILPFIFQAVKFDLYQHLINNILGTIIDLLICYMVLDIVKERFHITFISFIYFLALFSFIFYLTEFIPPLKESIKSTIGSIITPLGRGEVPEDMKSYTLIFYTYHYTHYAGIIHRNCGAFWEPGMFAVFLNLALLMNVYLNNSAILSKKNVVFIIAIITTMSTTGYIVLFLILITRFIFLEEKIKVLLSFPILAVFAYFSYTYVYSLEFMKGKIESNIESSGESRSSRFGAAVYHFEKLKKFPLFGVVIKAGEEEKNLLKNEIEATPNGLSSVFFYYGILVGIIFYCLLYIGISRWLLYNGVRNKLLHFLFFFVFLMLAFSQDVTVRMFYMMFLFFTICFPRYLLEKRIKIQEAPLTTLH